MACAAFVPSARADDQRVADLEAQLQEARARVKELEETLGKLADELDRLKAEQPSTKGAPAQEARTSREPAEEAGALAAEQRDAILVPDLGGDERDRRIGARPDLFLQTGFAADRVDDATADDAVTGFTLNRLEARWSGRVAERLGLGVEIQFQPATEGASEELVNDAFVEYYANEAVTLRVGQFVKPFGFDIQHSSSERESPERAMFAGYFFPGQRDRGAMVAADLSRTAEWLNGVSVYGAVLNGNRFFDDNNDALNVNVRIRKQFEERPFAIGVSFEHGSQLL
ncbi:MAG TPA: porin, partial [Gammaproteobacteria bacterium]|nr:porin [Gammaproteobacteria bacterium]